MTDYGGGGRIPRTLHTHDLVSGENLFIIYFPVEGLVSINGYAVTRSDEFQEALGMAVFHRTPTDKPFTVATESLSELYWEAPA